MDLVIRKDQLPIPVSRVDEFNVNMPEAGISTVVWIADSYMAEGLVLHAHTKYLLFKYIKVVRFPISSRSGILFRRSCEGTMLI